MVRNKFVKIQHGKEIVRKNNILDAYPEHIAKRQMGTLDTTSTGINETDNQFELSTLLLKLDTPLEGLKEMGVNKLNITGEDLEGDLSVVNNGDNSLTINGSLPVDEGTTVEGTSFTLTDAQPDKKASITKLEGNTTQNGTPTPTNPIPIYTVSGDNEVVICGKNKLDISKWVKGRINNTSGNIEYANNVSSMVISDNAITFTVSQAWNSGIASNFIPVSQGSYTYTYSHNREISMYIDAYNSNKTKISRLVSYTQSTTPTTRTFTVDSNTKYIRIHFEVNTANVSYEVSNMQLEKGSQATTYQAYTGNSYRVDFGGKNLCSMDNTNPNLCFAISNNNATRTIEGTLLTITPNTGVTATNKGVYWKLNTTYYQGLIANKNTTISFDLKAEGNCTISVPVESSGQGNIYNTFNATTEWKRYSVTFNRNLQNWTAISFYETDNTDKVFYIRNVMVALDSFHTYSPYVSNPIELCKIGNYRDSIKKSSGKQLFNKDNVIANKRLDSSGNLYTENGYSTSDFIQIEPSTAYTLQRKTSGGSSCYVLYDSNKTFISRVMTQTQTSWTFTTTDSTRYIRIADYTNDLNIIMLNKGSTALPYEPYGNNWYIEKNIGKVVLDGNTTGWSGGVVATDVYRFYRPIEGIKARTENTRYIDRFITDRFKLSTNNEYGATYQYHDNLYFCVSSNEATTGDSFKTWLSTHNITVYFVLATPSYEIITNENLIQQLNAIQDITLIENLCYVDWVGVEKPDMTLKYNYETEYEYDLGVQDFTLSANNTYNVNANGLGLKLANNNTIYEGAGTYTPTQDTEVTSAKLLIPLGVNFSSTVYPTVEKQSGLRNTEFDVHYVDSLDISVTNYKCFTTLTKNGCIARYQYTYDRHSRFRSYRDGQVYDMADLNGRRITAIGFACNWIGGGSYQSTREVLAVLDTSNYALYINQEIPMNITRVDEITSDAEFYTNNTEVTGPLHLDPLRTNCDKERGGIRR